MKCILTADIGSTFTKVTAVDIENKTILGTARAFTTVSENVARGFDAAMTKLYRICGNLEFTEKLAASSAYGGLKMVSVGLVPNLTSKAARMAAASAGAKVLKSFSYELSEDEIEEILHIAPDIILLTGGIDGGNKDVILSNASRLAGIPADFSVIIAGNKVAAKDCSRIIEASGKRCVVAGNVMPEFEKLNIAPAKDAVRSLFIEKIIQAKGLDKIQSTMSGNIVPTPLAVFDAVTLLSKGINGSGGIGALLAFDVGGATTDVYSCSTGIADKPNVVYKGIREPFTKRSVEADIGMRYSLPSLTDSAGFEGVAEKAGTDENAVRQWYGICLENPAAVPENETQAAVDRAFAAYAVEICADRHAGTIEKVYTHFGEVFMQTGKDLTEVKIVIGTGGVIVNSTDPGFILRHAYYSPLSPDILKPADAALYLDKSYILTSMGLLAQKYPAEALDIMKKYIVKQ